MPPLPEGTPFQRHCLKWRNGCGAEECERASKVVLARGKIPCDVLFIGEGPGASEDVAGIPFVGPAGHLLQQIIDQAVPENVRWAITNMVGCMPTDDDRVKSGEPTDEQVKACEPRLVEFVDTIARPRLIVCVGSIARDWLDPKYHHAVRFRETIPQVWIKHPAAILRETVASRGLSVQRCVVQIANAVAEMKQRDNVRTVASMPDFQKGVRQIGKGDKR